MGPVVAVKAPVIAGKYTLLRRLGHGGMAEVFLAKQMSEGGFEKLVVLKRILPHLAGGAEFVNMFLDEARVAADLRHPNIVTIVDVGRVADTLFMVMEFLHGQDIRKVQRKVAAFGQMIPFGHACQMVIDAAAGLHYAHTKVDLNGKPLSIVHRDVSPQNIIVTFEGSTKIVDFGIAKAAGQSSHTSTGVLKGKYTYMSPEQAQGEIVDARTDQFALGIVLWELLTMRRLFKRDTEGQTLEAIIDGNVPRPKRFRDDVPAAIEEVVMTALARDKHKRFRDCEALAFALEDALAKDGIVHSQSRLAQYMRRLFADQLAEEAAIGVVQPDGSLSVKNTFPMHRRDDADKPVEKPVEKAPEKRPPEKAEKKSPEVSGSQEKARDDAPVDATQADRKRTRSRTNTESERLAPKPEPPRSRDPEPRRDRDTDRDQGRDRATDRGRDRVDDRGVDRGGSRRVMLGAVAGGLVLLAVGVGVVVVGRGPGPATLVVRSEPKGAVVFIDGRDSGERTPALLKGVLSQEPHKLRLQLPGYVPLDEIVTIPKAGTTWEVSFTLVPEPR
jgi:eukaryotic-like serine/threonine-protein kinase